MTKFGHGPGKYHPYPPKGSFVIMVTRPLPPGFRPSTHFTSPLPIPFDSEAAARAYIGRLPRGEYGVEVLR